ncbi:hypothetical protein HUN08_04085 [Gordonia sp. X0973]|nr:hypothetical protein HUN08_04085 [Gordonia sp. X0973]
MPWAHDLGTPARRGWFVVGVPIVVVSRHLGNEDITTTLNCLGYIDRASGERPLP